MRSSRMLIYSLGIQLIGSLHLTCPLWRDLIVEDAKKEEM